MMTRLNSQSGLTLVELMVVVGIIGILAAIGIPSFKGVVPRVRLNNNAMVLGNEIALARVRSISKSTDFAIQFDTVNERYTLKRYDPAEVSLGATVVAGSDLYKTGSFTPAYNADGTFAPPTWAESTTSLVPANTLMFTANGQVPNIPLGDMAVVELRTPNGEIRKRIFVESTGRMHVWRWNGGAWTQE